MRRRFGCGVRVGLDVAVGRRRKKHEGEEEGRRTKEKEKEEERRRRTKNEEEEEGRRRRKIDLIRGEREREKSWGGYATVIRELGVCRNLRQSFGGLSQPNVKFWGLCPNYSFLI